MRNIKHLLLVDDNEVTNYLHTFLFLDMNMAEEVHSVLNGQEAIDYIKTCSKEDQPDLILLDINMPLMDGFEFLGHFENLDANESIVILMVSTSIIPRDIERSKQFKKISGFVGKPLTKEKILKLQAEYF
jgi:CheY-like chemotaxis protein